MSSVSCCGTTPRRARIRGPSTRGSMPRTDSSPPDTGETQAIIRIAEVLPAPFGPRKPKDSPGATSKSMASTAVIPPKRFVSPRARRRGAVGVSSMGGGVYPPGRGWVSRGPRYRTVGRADGGRSPGPAPWHAGNREARAGSPGLACSIDRGRAATGWPRRRGSDLLELAFDGLVLGVRGRSRLAGRVPCRAAGPAVRWRACGRVRRGPDLGKQVGELRGPRLDHVGLLGLERVADVGDLPLDGGAILGRDLLTEVLERALRLERERLRLVPRLDLLAAALVLGRVLGRLADHPVDVPLVQHRGRGDLDLLLLARGPVLRPDLHDAVRVDVERHLDLGHAARGGRDPVEDEAAQGLVVAGEVALALEDVDLHLGLVVRRRREDLALRRRDRRVALDELGHDAAEGLDAQR